MIGTVALSVLAQIASIAGSIGLSTWWNKYTVQKDLERSAKNGLTPGQVNQAVNALLSKASQKGEYALNQAQERLSRIQGLSQYAFGISKELMNREQSKASEGVRRLEKTMSDLESKANVIRQNTNDIAYMTDDFKNSATGKAMIKQNYDDAVKLNSSYEKLLGGKTI